MNKKNGKINKKSKIKKFITSIIIIIFLIILIIGMGLTFFVGGIYKDWLGRRIQSMAMLEEYYNIIVIRGNEKRIRYFNPLNPFGDSPPTKIYDRNNILIGEYMPPSYEVVNVDDINPLLEQTLLLMEDQQFYSHHGINYFQSNKCMTEFFQINTSIPLISKTHTSRSCRISLESNSFMRRVPL